jgi:hypothetical protein
MTSALTAKSDTSTTTIYLLACLHCADKHLPMVFLRSDTRSSWSVIHTEQTGHHDWYRLSEKVPQNESDGRSIPNVRRDFDGAPMTPRTMDRIEDLRLKLNGWHRWC